MNETIQRALKALAAVGGKEGVLLVPFALSRSQIEALRAMPHIRRLAVIAPPYPPSDRLHALDVTAPQRALEGTNALPVVVGGPALVNGALIWRALLSGHGAMICEFEGRFQKVSLIRFMTLAAGDRLIDRLHGLSSSHPLVRLARLFRRMGPLRVLWHATASHGLSDQASRYAATQGLEGLSEAPVGAAISGRIVLANVGLAAGGAERQLVNTAAGMHDHGKHDIIFLGEHVLDIAGLDHNASRLDELKIPIRQLASNATEARLGLSRIAESCGEIAARIPTRPGRTILCLANELATLRPETVHAWQDLTNIRVGLAALMTGVPRIILSIRGVAPPRAALPGLDMRAAYRSLAQSTRVVLVTNSIAGAESYASWLGLPAERFRVIRNGINLEGLPPPRSAEIARFRHDHGIASETPLVCGVLRPVPAKRPELWFIVAERLLTRLPGCHFVVAGLDRDTLPHTPSVKALFAAGRLHALGVRDDMPVVLAASGVLLVTSESEGTPNAVLEAQALGVPVVTTRAGGLRECMIPDITGLIRDTENPDELAKMLEKALVDIAFRESTRTQGPEFVAEHFGLPRMIRETLAVYDATS